MDSHDPKSLPDTGAPEPLLCPEDSLVGTVLADRFLLKRCIGAGAVGEVYLAEHLVLGVSYAVKVLREDFADDEEMVERFRREAYAASRLHHPHIVQTHDFGRTEDDDLYLVMEYVDGVMLRHLIDEHAPAPLPLKRGLTVLHQLGSALQQAHEASIVHRDLKPDNLLLATGRDGQDVVKVLDFGLAKVLEDDQSPITRLGQVFGSPQYMSPEQARGAPVDTRSDIYSFGVLAYEVLCGRTPFRYASVPHLLMAHMEEDPPAFSAVRPQDAPPLPGPLQAVVLRCLEKDPDARPQTIVEACEVLQAQLEELPATGQRAIPQDLERVIRDTGVDTSTPESPLAALSQAQWLPEGQAATLRTMDAPLEAPSARPSDPAYREWYWGQAVKLAVQLAELLLASEVLGERARAEGLGPIMAEASKAENRSIEAQAEVALTEAALADLEADADSVERDLRYAIVDLSMTLGTAMDAATRDPDREADLKEQVAQLEQNLSAHLQDKAARLADLERQLEQRRDRLLQRHAAQVDRETALMAALQQVRPDPLPSVLRAQYQQLSQYLKSLQAR